MPHYEASLVPASEMTIKRSIAMLSTGWPAARLSEEEAEARHMLYHAGLNDIPADLLSEACRQAVRTCKFFPSVAELRERCPELQMRKWRLWRIQFLIEDHDRNWREPEVYEPLSAEDQAKVDGFLRRAGIKAGAS